MKDELERVAEETREQVEKESKRKKLISVGSILLAASSILFFTGLPGETLGLNENNSDTVDGGDRSWDSDVEVVVASNIQPYSTRVGSEGVVAFTNVRNEPVSVVFETGIRSLTVEAGSRRYVSLSEYNDLPEDNYFEAGGEGGRLVIR